MHSGDSFAMGTYQTPEEFLQEVFSNGVPDLKKVWINAQIKNEVKQILGHELGVLRIAYWQNDARTVWILEEIGRDHPITVGVVVNQTGIELLKVLIFRETRGWEVRYPFFTQLFFQLGLDSKNELTSKIDGISGATLSVIALEKVARLALFLHQHVMAK
jgi:hypothetical protein